MSFLTDSQTLRDLGILGRFQQKSLYSIFNGTKTAGGARLLEEMFQFPLTDALEINKRSQLLSYFQHLDLIFPLDAERCEFIENYLASAGVKNGFASALSLGRKKFLYMIGVPEEYELELKGLTATLSGVKEICDFFLKLVNEKQDEVYTGKLNEILNLIENQELQHLLRQANAKSNLYLMWSFQRALRNSLAEKLQFMFSVVYELDVLISVAGIAKSKGFNYAKALANKINFIDIKEFRHPALDQGITNTVTLKEDQNVLFLTGANMAGKSTLMKSFASIIYLAHMGFPVSAKQMEFAVLDGIFTSINVPDDLNQGYSHFYAEVLRVKKVAEAVASGKNLVVIFDELFKGTNVKDAYDATLAVTEAFAENRNCSFIISTHIIEVGEELRKNCSNLQFKFMPTLMMENIPTYPYVLKNGITSDRHGMMIIENEGILNMLNQV